MCRWRHVQNLYLRCGHTESLVSRHGTNMVELVADAAVFQPPVEVCLDSSSRLTQFMGLMKVKCSSAKCKFSPNHPAGCVPPLCRTTCNQYHMFPEQYAPNEDGFCTACRKAMQ
ncbi:hypothetical protein C8F04DRAFT_624365 [Mycena alexandri]|uniref:Uncharacterized protein n=1 Tax=Mycena alexandri TaxID=1745969 RepID=A0AAD6SVY3_9AGAR|nr:hypothetical protein C8F04DRAFT_624365 [Mycena alexandri]